LVKPNGYVYMIVVVPKLDENGNVEDEYEGTLVIGAGGRGVKGGMAAATGGLAVQLLVVQSLVGHSCRELQEL
jgi:hypothetical protein